MIYTDRNVMLMTHKQSLLLLLLAFAASLYAQESRGSIRGRVTDTTDAVVLRASVTATNVNTSAHASGETNDSGNYEIPYLLPGTLVSVEFRFTCSLNPGSYFLNAGVTGINQDEETYLHRVLDLCMFKVMPVSDDTATAIIDFNCVAEIELMNNLLQKVAIE